MKWLGLLTSQHNYITLHDHVRHTSLKDELVGEFGLMIANCPMHVPQVVGLPFHKTVWPKECSCGWQTIVLVVLVVVVVMVVVVAVGGGGGDGGGGGGAGGGGDSLWRIVTECVDEGMDCMYW